MNKQTTSKVMSPICEAQWVFLREPCRDYNSYEIDLILNPRGNAEHKAFMTGLKNLLPQGSNTTPWRARQEHPGEYILKLRQKAQVKGKDGRLVDIKPAVYDANANIMPDVPLIGNGSKLCVSIEVRSYSYSGKVGIRLNPEAVQIVELVPYVPKDSASNPFSGGDSSTGPELTPPNAGFQPVAGAQVPAQVVPQVQPQDHGYVVTSTGPQNNNNSNQYAPTFDADF